MDGQGGRDERLKQEYQAVRGREEESKGRNIGRDS